MPPDQWNGPLGPSQPQGDATTTSHRQATGTAQFYGTGYTTAFDRLVAALESHGCNVRTNGHGKAQAQCPAHDDRNPSLSISPRHDGKGAVMHCHAGCHVADVAAALGLTMPDLFDDDSLRAAYSTTATYTYPGGRQVHRKPDKQFPQSGNKQDRTLFHGDRIGDATTVYAVEGEKDALAVEADGGTAVCSAMGAGKAHLADWTPLTGRNVTIIAHKDEPGRKHAAQTAQLLNGIAKSIRVVEAKAGNDAADHIAAGYTLNELINAPSDGTPKLWRATDLKPAAQPRWLARNRIPYAAVTLLVGDEGIGKSLLWVWVVAAVTTGKALPAFGIPAREPSPIIIVVTEDGWQDTVLPRLEVAGADLDMVRVICTEEDGSGSPVFPRDLFLIAEADPKPALIIVDAWLDTVPAALSVRDPQQARQALHPFKEIATITDAAVMLLCHTNRVATPNARDRYGATGELRKKARMTLYAQTDEDGCLLVGPEKTNTAKPIPASKFTITAVRHFDPTEDHDGTVPLLSHIGESEQTAREHLADNYAADRDTDGAANTLAWLAVFLAAGPRWATDIFAAAEQDGHSERKVRKAKLDLHAAAERAGTKGRWFWRLPQHQGEPQTTPDDHLSPSGHLEHLERYLRLSDDASTSQDIQMINGEIQGHLEKRENQGSTAQSGPYSSPCASCGKFVAVTDGLCAWCSAKASQ